MILFFLLSVIDLTYKLVKRKCYVTYQRYLQLLYFLLFSCILWVLLASAHSFLHCWLEEFSAYLSFYSKNLFSIGWIAKNIWKENKHNENFYDSNQHWKPHNTSISWLKNSFVAKKNISEVKKRRMWEWYDPLIVDRKKKAN